MKNIRNEKGIAMVLTLMVILVLSVMASGLMYNIVNEKTITANRMRSSQALALAKAGQAEAIARLSIPYSNSNDTVSSENWAPRLNAKSSVNARIWRTSFSFM
jgi:type II secretory pathway component PulK